MKILLNTGILLVLLLLSSCGSDDDTTTAETEAQEQTIVSTFAGSTLGFEDGIGTAAQFDDPTGIAIDALGNLYVVDRDNHRIRKISPSGEVTTLAGSTYGFADGTGTAAQFGFPEGIAIDTGGNLYVVDSNNHRIRKITPSGDVSTLAGSNTSGLADGIGTAALFNFPRGITIDAANNLYVVDTNNDRIRKITPSGEVTTIAGSGTPGPTGGGFADGSGSTAQFDTPEGITIDVSGNLYVTDTGNHKIRKITSSGEVTTVAGVSDLGFLGGGFADGTVANAKFSRPIGIAIDVNDNLYIVDIGNHRIRKITPSGEVSTLAGSTEGSADGSGVSAQFNFPEGITIDEDGDLYITDTDNNLIRKITIE